MDNQGAVSVWMGNCSSEDLIREYLDIKYNEHGDRIPSKFMVDFKINFIDLDEDLIEYSYKNSPISSLRQLLKDASDSEIMINELEEFYGSELTYRFSLICSESKMHCGLRYSCSYQSIFYKVVQINPWEWFV